MAKDSQVAKTGDLRKEHCPCFQRPSLSAVQRLNRYTIKWCIVSNSACYLGHPCSYVLLIPHLPSCIWTVSSHHSTLCWEKRSLQVETTSLPLSAGGLHGFSASIKINLRRHTNLISLLSHPRYQCQPQMGLPVGWPTASPSPAPTSLSLCEAARILVSNLKLYEEPN